MNPAHGNERVLQEFEGITNAEAYIKIFKERLMKPVPGRVAEFYGCNNRIDMLPHIQNLVLNLPQGGQIFDVGAGAGDVVDFALKDAAPGTTINIVEPNHHMFEEYIQKIHKYPHLRLGTPYNGRLQDYYQAIQQAERPSQPQNLILAMHMIYFLTDFMDENIHPREDLIEAFSFLYELLAPGGSIFVAYADLEYESVASLTDKYLRTLFPNEKYADNLESIFRARNEVLGPNGTIAHELQKRFPGTKPILHSKWRMCHFFGESAADIAALGLISELNSFNEEKFDMRKLRFCLDYIMQNPDHVGLKIEDGPVPQRGLWRTNQPHITAIITKQL